jgi:subtilisin family serine protease
MSLGAPVVVGTPPTVAYENAGRAALNAGSLIIAAAGNSGTSATQFPVGRPANSPSIMAVAAVDQNLQRAPFSCRAANPNGGEVNIAGPGVAVFSSTKIPPRYAVMSGTSMATPHVAGIAALWSQRTGARGTALWQKLISTARPIGQPATLVGSGLVQAPQ